MAIRRAICEWCGQAFMIDGVECLCLQCEKKDIDEEAFEIVSQLRTELAETIRAEERAKVLEEVERYKAALEAIEDLHSDDPCDHSPEDAAFCARCMARLTLNPEEE